MNILSSAQSVLSKLVGGVSTTAGLLENLPKIIVGAQNLSTLVHGVMSEVETKDDLDTKLTKALNLVETFVNEEFPEFDQGFATIAADVEAFAKAVGTLYAQGSAIVSDVKSAV